MREFVAFRFSGFRAQGCGFEGCVVVGFRVLMLPARGFRVRVEGLGAWPFQVWPIEKEKGRGSQAKRAHVEASALHCSPKKALHSALGP